MRTIHAIHVCKAHEHVTKKPKPLSPYCLRLVQITVIGRSRYAWASGQAVMPRARDVPLRRFGRPAGRHYGCVRRWASQTDENSNAT